MTPREWLAVLVLTFTGTFLGMIFTIVAPVLPMMSAQFGGGEHGAFVAGWLLTMPSIGVVVGGPLTGWSIERLGTRTVLFGCLAIYGISGAAGAVLQNDAALLASRLILGLAATGQVVAATGIVGEMFADERRGRMIGFQTAFATISVVASTLLSGALAEAAGWRAPFALYTLSFVVLALGILTIRGQRREAISRSQSVRPASLLPFLPIYVFAMIANVISFFSTSQIPILLSTDGVSAPSMISMVLGGGTLAFTAGASFYGKICAKYGIRRT